MNEEIKTLAEKKERIQGLIKNLSEDHKSIISALESVTSGLEEQIEILRSKIGDGERICKYCGYESMTCMGLIPKNGYDIKEDRPVYLCGTCGKTNL